MLLILGCGNDLVQPGTRVVGYLPTWINIQYHTQHLDFKKFSHINLAFANPDAEGNLDEQLNDEDLHAFISKAHSEGVTVLISVAGAYAPPYWHQLVKEENRSAFISKIMDYLRTYRFDGIDVDLEGSDITADYGGFVLELSRAVQKEGLLMTAALASWNGSKIPDQALAAFDFINLMAYDAAGPWNPDEPGQHSSMQFARQNLDYWTKTRGVPADQCVLGVPFYGYDFDNKGKSLRYSNIVTLQENAAYLDQIGQIYYNGKPTIAVKTALGLEYGGIMIWEISQDAPAPHSLLDTIYSTIQQKESSIQKK